MGDYWLAGVWFGVVEGASLLGVRFGLRVTSVKYAGSVGLGL